jgi:uncharacterized membrane protein
MASWWRRLAPGLLLLGGIGAIAEAVATGQARLYLVVIVPVVSGSSPLLALGVVALLAGLLALPFAFGAEAPPRSLPTAPRAAPPGAPPAPREAMGGVVIVGPFPIFFGGWRRPSRRAYWLAVVVGVAALVVLVAVALAAL